MKEVTESKHLFWPYDVFGYLLPGAIVLSAVITLDSPIRERVYELFSAGSWFHVVVLVVASYITGHIIASVSSFLIERIYQKEIFGYPACQFLGEQSRVWKRVYRVPFLAWLFRHAFPGHSDAWTPEYQNLLKASYAKAIGRAADSPIEPTPANIFWSANVYVAEHSAFAFRYASHFVELYGFSRNACCGFCVLAVLASWRGWNLTVNDTVVVPYPCLGYFALIVSYLLLHNYTKLFRRHNDQVLRAFIVAVGKVEEEKPETAG